MDKWLRVDCDYNAEGLWDERGRMISAADVPLTDALRQRLLAWQAWFNEAADPFGNDVYNAELHTLTGEDIARCIKRELPYYTVVAFDRVLKADGTLGGRVPWPGECTSADPRSLTDQRQMLAHIALIVRDYDEALAFYVGKLGFTLVEDTPVPEQGKRWVVIAPPGAPPHATTILLARAASPQQEAAIGNQAAGRVILFLATDDFARDHAAYAQAGVRFVRPPREEDYGTVAVFEDLYGNRWDLIEHPRR